MINAARNFYTIHREFAGGKGFADMVFLPRKKFPDKPALVIELKWDHSAQGAITQIKQKQYCESLKEYHGNLLLVGINYAYCLDSRTMSCPDLVRTSQLFCGSFRFALHF